MEVDKEKKRKRKRSKSDKKKESHEDAALSSDVDKIDCDEPLLEVKPNTTDEVSYSDAEQSRGEIVANCGEKTSEKSEKNDVSVRESEQVGDKEEVPAKRKRKRKRKKGGESQNESSAVPEEDADVNAKKMTSVDYTVFVEGIPFDCTEDEVGNFFAVNGCKDVIQMRLPRWQDTGRLRGFGHIVFSSTDSRLKAIEKLNGLNLRKRYLTIKAPNQARPDTTVGALVAQQNSSAGSTPARVQPEGCKVVFIKNLPYSAMEQDIQEVFRVFGKIAEDGGVRLARNYVTRQPKGFGYVEFKNPEGAAAAVQKAAKPFGIVVGGRPCFVDYDDNNGGGIKGSFKTEEGKLWSKEHTVTNAGPNGKPVGQTQDSLLQNSAP